MNRQWHFLKCPVKSDFRTTLFSANIGRNVNNLDILLKLLCTAVQLPSGLLQFSTVQFSSVLGILTESRVRHWPLHWNEVQCPPEGVLQYCQYTATVRVHHVPRHYSAVQCGVLQCTVVHCSAVQCSAVQCSAAIRLFSPVPMSAGQCSAAQCSAAQPFVCTRLSQ